MSFLDKKGRQCEIPLGWTDLAPEDAFITLAAGKSWFRAADLLELARLVEAFGMRCKGKFRPYVSDNYAHAAARIRMAVYIMMQFLFKSQ